MQKNVNVKRMYCFVFLICFMYTLCNLYQAKASVNLRGASALSVFVHTIFFR